MGRGCDVLVCSEGDVFVGFFGELTSNCEFPFLPIRVFWLMLMIYPHKKLKISAYVEVKGEATAASQRSCTGPSLASYQENPLPPYHPQYHGALHQ